MMLKNDNILEWIRLIRSTNVGPITFWRLVERHGSVSNVIKALPKIADRLERTISLCDESIAIQELEKAHRLGVHLVAGFHEDYPALLKHISDVPPILYVWGQRSVLNRPTVGIVGARNSSLVARRLTEQFAKELGEAGYVTASGLARGIDRHVHKGSLKTGTIAVVAGGVDVIYPPEHRELHTQIRENGCVISEMNLGLHPGSTHFPRRNRIISGLSEGTLVVEAALKSGSLITARYALEQNRELFSMPGSPQDPRCQGSNELIRKGAHLVQSAGDVIEILKSGIKKKPQPFQYELSLEEQEEGYQAGRSEEEAILEDPKLAQIILGDLSYTPIAIDFLVEQYQVPVSQIMSVLLDLELVGLIVRYPNGTVALQDEDGTEVQIGKIAC